MRWESWIPSVDLATVREDSEVVGDRLGDRLVAVYGVGTEIWRITLLEASAGTRLWDVPLRSIFAVDWIEHVVLTPTRVPMERTRSLDVIDASDGHLIGTVGDDTYDNGSAVSRPNSA